MELFRLFGTILVDNSKANKELSETDEKAEDTAKSIGEITKEAGIMATAIAAAATAFLTAIGVKSVMAVNDLQKSMNLLQMQTGASDADMKKFKVTAEKLYEGDYGESFEDIARAMSDISRNTGLSGKELENTTKNAINLRDTFAFGVNESARTANSLMKNFGISADQAYTLIAQGAQQGANKNGDLLDTLNEYSVQFSAMGMSAEEFTSVLIDGANNGAFSVDKIGDAVKEFTIRSKDGSTTSAEAFQKLGFDAQQMTQSFAAGGEQARSAFDEVVTALGNISDPVQKNAIGVALFGTQFEDLEAGAIQALGNIQSKADSSANTLKKIDDTKTDSFGSKLSQLGRKLETDFFIPLGEKLMPLLDSFVLWIEDNSETIDAVLGGAVDVVAGIFNSLADAVQFVIDNMNILGPIVIGLTATIVAQQVINMIVSLYKSWQAATVGMTTVQWLLNAAMAANPFGIIALAIGGLIAIIALLVENWEWVSDVAMSIFGPIGDFFVAVADTIGQAFSFMGDIIKDVFSAIWDFIKIPINFFIGGINLLIDAFETILNLAVDAINLLPDFEIPDWVPLIGGGTFGIPDIDPVSFGRIPLLAEGGIIQQSGTVLVGEEGPEFLDLPRGAQVRPLDKMNESIIININNPKLFNDRDAEKMGDTLVRYLKTKGIRPRGV